MRKLYMMLLALLALPMTAVAETETFDLTALELDNGAQVPRQTQGPVNVRFAAGGNFMAPMYHDGAVRVNSQCDIIIDTQVGVIESVTITAKEAFYPGTFTSDFGVWQQTDMCADVNASKVTIRNSSYFQVDVTSIVVTYANKPAITPAPGLYYHPVEVSIKGSGDVFYTLTPAGTEAVDPTAESTKYTGPFTLDYSATLRAVSIVDGVASGVSEAVYEIKEPINVASVDEIMAATGMVKTTVPMIVIYQSYRDIYASIGGQTAQILTYNVDIPVGLVNGDVIEAGALMLVEEGYYSETSISLEGNIVIGTPTDPVQPTIVTDLSTLTSLPNNSFITIVKANYDSEEREIIAGDLNMQYYVLDYETCDYPSGNGVYNFTGFISSDSWGYTFNALALEYAGAVALPVIETERGDIYENEAVINIVCPEGTTVYYTTDGTIPTTDSQVVVDGKVTLTESCTLTVIAAKDGEFSGTASAEIRVKAVRTVSSIAEAWALGDGAIATFDFPVTIVAISNYALYVTANGEFTAVTFYGDNSRYSVGHVLSAGLSVEVSLGWSSSMYVEGELPDVAETAAPLPTPTAFAADTELTAELNYVYYELTGFEVVEGMYYSELVGPNGEKYNLNSEYTSIPTGKFTICGYFVVTDFGTTFYPLSYTEKPSSGIKSATIDSDNIRIYNINGVDCGTDADNLTPGLYIISGKKVLVK